MARRAPAPGRSASGRPPAAPLIELRGVGRAFPAGEGLAAVLSDIDLTIEAGEKVAVIGASGSGKSTLMNILGCLDRPSAGTYRISGREVGDLGPDQLAALRREHFGFIFQRYHLLAELDALGNVEMPAIYAGQGREARRARAAALLARLGMADRLGHRPGQLSGGQQQRVSIARALMNGGEAILADEPTGALDSRAGEEVLRILDELHGEGRTVVIVTHDPEVAARAERVIEIADGRIVSDRRAPPGGTRPERDAPPGPAGAAPAPSASPAGAGTEAPAAPAASSAPPPPSASPAPSPPPPPARGRGAGGPLARLGRLREAAAMARRAILAHRLRSFLTMLGIVIGIASVISVVALGEGSRRQVLEDISSLGASTLEIFPGEGFGDVRSGRIRTLTVGDAEAIARLPYAAAVTPTVSTSAVVRRAGVEANALVNGVGAAYFDAAGAALLSGLAFGPAEVRAMTQDAVIDETARRTLFPEDPEAALGAVLMVGSKPVRVVGVAETRRGGFGASNNLSLYLPYTTVQARFTGDRTLRSITLRVAEEVEMAAAEQAVTAFLEARHGKRDFFILNTDDIRNTITATTQTLTLLIAGIALISLLVGGVGVMNIMLVSVSERTGEIGVRMAVGARRSDILQQFLTEAVTLCALGGVLGVLAALGLGRLFALAGAGYELVYSPGPVLAAVLFSTLIGVGFGYLPARGASRLAPVAALQTG